MTTAIAPTTNAETEGPPVEIPPCIITTADADALADRLGESLLPEFFNDAARLEFARGFGHFKNYLIHHANAYGLKTVGEAHGEPGSHTVGGIFEMLFGRNRRFKEQREFWRHVAGLKDTQDRELEDLIGDDRNPRPSTMYAAGCIVAARRLWNSVKGRI